MNFDNTLLSKALEPIPEASHFMNEDVYHGKAFPYSTITPEMKGRMVALFEELEVRPVLKEVFEQSYEEFHLNLKPKFWWHEFVYEKQKYLFSYFGKDSIAISTQGATFEISKRLSGHVHWTKAMSLLSGKDHSPSIQKEFDRLIEWITVSFIKELKDEESENGFYFHNNSFYLSSFINTWQNTMKGSRSDFEPFINYFYKKATPYLEKLDAKHRLKNQVYDEDYFYSATWSLVLNEKKLNRRLAISSKKEPKFRIKKIGGMLRKIRSYYDAGVIKALYRNHVFSANIANWLSCADPKVRLYRTQALDSHKTFIPYFQNFNEGSELYSYDESLFAMDFNFINHADYFEKSEDLLRRMFFESTNQKNRNHPNSSNYLKDINNKNIFLKIQKGLKSIDEGASVDTWILEVLTECSFISAAPLVYQDELKQLLKIGFRRMKEKSPSLAAFMSNGSWNILRLVEFLLYLGLMDNNYQVKNPKQAKARLNHINHNLLNKSLSFILPFHLAHPNKKGRAISLKEYFAMVSTLKEDSWSQSSWGELLVSRSLRDTFSWYFHGNIITYNSGDGGDTLYKIFLNCFVLKGLFPSLKNWDAKMHEIQGRVERESERSDTNLSWLPVIKQENNLILNGVEVKELTWNYELKQQGEKEHHCVGGYYWTCMRGDSRIFSLEKNGVILSTLEISQRKQHGKWAINQNYAAKNNKASQEAQKTASNLVRMLNSKKERERFNAIPLTPNVPDQYHSHLRELDEMKQKRLKEEVRKATEKDFFQIHQVLCFAEKLCSDLQSGKRDYFLIDNQEIKEYEDNLNF